MSETPANFHQQFSCLIKGKIEGPFDLIEIAGLFREGIIDGETTVSPVNTDDWQPLRERSEYKAVQEIPVDVIARHIHEKERAGLLAQTPSKKSPLLLWGAFGFAMAIIGIMAIWSQPQPAVEPPSPSPATPVVLQTDWPETTGEHFSVKCPLLLHPEKPPRASVVLYGAMDEGERFGVEIMSLPGLSDAEYQRYVDEIQSLFLERQRHASAQVTTTISGDGYQGQEVSFKVVVESDDESGKVRFVFGKGAIFTIWAIAKPDKLSPQDVDRFLTSLKVR